MILVAAESWYPILSNRLIITKLKRQQLNIGRTIFQFIKKDVEFSGYQGCRTMDKHYPIYRNVVSIVEPYRYMAWNKNLYGFHVEHGNCKAKLPSAVCKKVSEGTDVLVIYNVPLVFLSLSNNMLSRNEELHVQKAGIVREKSVILISDCSQGDVFVADQVEGDKIYHKKTIGTNKKEELSKTYSTNAKVVELQTLIYYLGLPSRQAFNSSSYSLYRYDLAHEATEILEGIKTFQVEYYWVSKNLIGQYQKAIDIPEGEWSNVLGVRIIIITLENKEWEYEFAVRNRHSDGIGSRLNDSDFLIGSAPYDP